MIRPDELQGPGLGAVNDPVSCDPFLIRLDLSHAAALPSFRLSPHLLIVKFRGHGRLLRPATF